MRATCRHGNPLFNSCSFCKFEGRREDQSPKAIPGAGQDLLPTLVCLNCDYSTVYRDALRRHVCDCTVQQSVEETAQGLVADLFRALPLKKRVAIRVRSLAERLAIPWPRLQGARLQGVSAKETDEDKLARAESYLLLLCAKLEIKTPFLFFADEMQNSQACGEAGQSTIWLQKSYTLTKNWSDVQRTIRHEVAHILVHNTPGMGKVPAHGVEFDAALIVVEKA